MKAKYKRIKRNEIINTTKPKNIKVFNYGLAILKAIYAFLVVSYHIFDPKTGHPCEGDLESVTIVTSSGKYADTLSTALFVMGKEDAVEWWKDNSDFDFILITKDRELVYSAGLQNFLEPLYQFKTVEVVHR